MRIFADKEMTKSIRSIYFGKVKAGTTKEVTIFLYNDSKAILANLKYEFPGLPKEESLEIVAAPVNIKPSVLQPLRLRWKPSKNFKQALVVEIEISGEEIYMAPKLFRVERKERNG